MTQDTFTCGKDGLLPQQHDFDIADHPSPQLEYLPNLIRLLPAHTMIPSYNDKEAEGYFSAQPPSTILSINDSSLESVDLFNNTSPESDPSTCMITTTRDAIEDPLYMNELTMSSIMNETFMHPSSSISASVLIDPLFSCAQSGSCLYSTENRHRQHSISSSSSSSSSTTTSSSLDSKVHTFVPILGKKRPRRRYDEIERLYHCTFGECKKSYGTLNHLNSHILLQGHGPKRPASEFKEMRKEWRQLRKQRFIKNQVNKQQHNWTSPSLTGLFY